MSSSEFYKRNLERLRARWPAIARRVEEAPPLPAGAVEAGRGGEPCLRLAGEDGRPVTFHSKYDPRSEARGLIESAGVLPGDSTIILGLGLGYALELLLAENRPGLVVAAERSPEVFRAALERADLTAFFERDDAELIIGGGPRDLFEVLERRLSRLFGGNLRIIIHPPSARAFPAHYGALKRSLDEFLKHGTVVMRSALFLSRVSLENRFRNLPWYIESPGIRPLLGRFRGHPAVVVSAGPSLDRNLHLLPALRGKAVVIAVSTALKILLGRGVRPDLSAVIDYHPISARYFEGVPADGVLLACDPKASPAAVEAFRGPKLFGADPLMDLLLEGSAGEKGILAGGSTVAHAAFDLARRMGCDPIIFVGQDLSYPEGRLHAAGSATSAQQLPETNRFYSLEMKEWEYYLAHRKSLSRIPGALGGEVWTCDVFLTYLREFEKMFSETPATIIDATEGGALKAGTTVLTLAEAIAKYGGRDLPEGAFCLDPRPGEPPPAERRRKCREVLERRIEEGRELEADYGRALGHLEEVIAVNKKGRAADEAAAKAIALRENFRRHDLLFGLLNQIAQADLFLRQKRDREIDTSRLEGVERQRALAERDREYVQGLRGSLKFLLERMETAAERLGAGGSDLPG